MRKDTNRRSSCIRSFVTFWESLINLGRFLFRGLREPFDVRTEKGTFFASGLREAFDVRTEKLIDSKTPSKSVCNVFL